MVLATVDDKRSPIVYGFDDKLHVYFRQGPVITVGSNLGEADASAATRASGRGSMSDPDVIQGRPYEPPEKTVKRSPRDQELYIPEDLPERIRWSIPPWNQQPRVVLRFAAEKDLTQRHDHRGIRDRGRACRSRRTPWPGLHTVICHKSYLAWRDDKQLLPNI